jgi:thymidylate synthase
MNKLDKDYLALLQDILDNGTKKETRNGGTISLFGRQIRHKMSNGFPLLTTKKMAWKSMVTELLWFLRGDTNIRYLVDNNCHIWNGDAYKNWCKQFEVDPNNFDSEELAKGHNDQCWGYPLLENTSKEYKRGQINAYLEGKAERPFFYLTQEEFINKIKTDDKFAKKWGSLGPVYGKQWRKWSLFPETEIYDYGINSNGSKYPISRYKRIDQIANLINDLKTNPDSRRLMVNAWNVGELDQMTLLPCHYGFQVYTRELSLEERLCIADKFNPLIREDCLTKTHHTDETEELKLVYRHEFLDSLGPNVVPQRRAISLMWNQRSADTPLGLPFNIASYALLLEIIAKTVNMVPDELIGNLGDCHIYENQIQGVKEQLTREPFALPTLNINTEFWPYEDGSCGEGPLDAIAVFNAFKDENFCKCLLEEDIQLCNYQSHPSIKLPLSN